MDESVNEFDPFSDWEIETIATTEQGRFIELTNHYWEVRVSYISDTIGIKRIADTNYRIIEDVDPPLVTRAYLIMHAIHNCYHEIESIK